MNSSELLDLFRSTIVDEVEPYLWSDVEAFRYMDDAQKTFCRLTGGLGDGSSALTQLVYTAASDWVDLSPLILKIKGATDSVTGRSVPVFNYEDLRARDLGFSAATGPIQALVTGIEENRARLYPFPAVAGQLNLMVDRLPLKPITEIGSQKLEIAEQHHQALLKWMMHRAYSKQDAETMNNKKATEYEMDFKTYCFDAAAEKERALHKTRVVRYGGI